MRVCLGKHSCMSSPFPIAILNGSSKQRQHLRDGARCPAARAEALDFAGLSTNFKFVYTEEFREVNVRVLVKGLELLSANGGRFEINQLLFADDPALVADSEDKLCRLVSEFGESMRKKKVETECR